MAVQSFPNTQPENFSRCYIGSDVSVVVACKADDMGYNTKKRVCIDEECIGFPIAQLDWSGRIIPVRGGEGRKCSDGIRS